MSIAISLDATETPPFPVLRFTVEQYHRLGEFGLLSPEDRVELLEGWIVEKMNQRPIHGFTVRLLSDWFQSRLVPGWLAQCQLPITTQFSEPEPDLAIVRGHHADFRDQHPCGSDCRLIVEVADTSLSKDRAKAAIYAAAGVEEYWIVNLVENQVERFTQSDGTTYLETTILKSIDVIEFHLADQMLLLPLDILFG